MFVYDLFKKRDWNARNWVNGESEWRSKGYKGYKKKKTSGANVTDGNRKNSRGDANYPV